MTTTTAYLSAGVAAPTSDHATHTDTDKHGATRWTLTSPETVAAFRAVGGVIAGHPEGATTTPIARETPLETAPGPGDEAPAHTCGTACPACQLAAGHYADQSADPQGRRLMTADYFEDTYKPMPTDTGVYLRTVYPDTPEDAGRVWAVVEPAEHHGLVQHVVPVRDFLAAAELAPVGYVVTSHAHTGGTRPTTDRAQWTDLSGLFD